MRLEIEKEHSPGEFFKKDMFLMCYDSWKEVVQNTTGDEELVEKCGELVDDYLDYKIKMKKEQGEEIYDVSLFNACYTGWMRRLLEQTGDRDLVEECDWKVAKIVGKGMALKLKKIRPEFAEASKIDSVQTLVEAIKYTHWFQENVDISEPFKKDGKEIVKLKVNSCSWQRYWKDQHGEYYPQCLRPHGAMLMSFCKELTQKSSVKNTEAPGSSLGCGWELSLED